MRAPVPAANRGVVLLARTFGIYGNTVVNNGNGTITITWTAGELYEAATADGPYTATGNTSGELTISAADQAYYKAVVE